MAFPISGSKRRRRSFPDHIFGISTDCWFVLLTTDIAIGRKTEKVRSMRMINEKKMEVSWSDHIPGSGIDHDLLCSYWWMDFKIYRDLSYKFGKTGSSR